MNHETSNQTEIQSTQRQSQQIQSQQRQLQHSSSQHSSSQHGKGRQGQGRQGQNVLCDFISLKQLAVLLGVSYETTRKWRARGVLPHTIVLPNGQIRISLADLDAWLEERTS